MDTNPETIFIVRQYGELSRHATETEALVAGALASADGTRTWVVELPDGYREHPSERWIAEWWQRVPFPRPELRSQRDALTREIAMQAQAARTAEVSP